MDDSSMTSHMTHDHTSHSGTDSMLESMNEAMSESMSMSDAHVMASGHGSVFTVGDQEDITFLFSGWDLSDDGAYIGALLFTFCLAVFYEWLNTFSCHLDLKLAEKHTNTVSSIKDVEAAAPHSSAGGENKVSGEAATVATAIATVPVKQERDACFSLGQQATRSLVATLRTLISLVLMLVFMYFDVRLCVVLVAGAFVGHFAFARDIDAAVMAGGPGQHCRA